MRALAEACAPRPAAQHNRPDDPPEHAAEVLTEGGREALIRLNDQIYTLRITRQGKLLLTK